MDPSLPVHPTFLYESIWCLLGFFLLWAYMKRRKFHGELILMYVMWYGAERFFVEGLRTDSLMVGSFRISQVIAAVSVIAALCIWLALRKKYKDKPLTVTYTALVKEDGRQVPYEFSWLSGEPPPPAEMTAEIERRRAPARRRKPRRRKRKRLKQKKAAGRPASRSSGKRRRTPRPRPKKSRRLLCRRPPRMQRKKTAPMRSRRNNSGKTETV